MNKQRADLRLYDLGKVPPQAVDIEELILGSVLLTNQCYEVVFPNMNEDFFYKDSHQKIFLAMKEMYNSREPIDIRTVTHYLRKSGDLDIVGGAYAVSQLTNSIASTANIDAHVKIVTQKYIQRSIIKNCTEMITESYEDASDVFDTLNKLENFTTEINSFISGGDHQIDFAKGVMDVYQKITTYNENELNGMCTGNAKLNSITGGWQRKDLVLLCARPGMGKSTRALEFSLSAINKGFKPCIFSLEMSQEQLIKKYLINKSLVSANRVTNRSLSEKDILDLSNAASQLMTYPIYINDKAGVNVNYIRSVLRQRKKKFGVDICIIDYLQLLKNNENMKGRTREQEISSISIALKELAKELDIAVIALSQLNREVEKRSDKRPIKSDLRESGQLEQDADLIIGNYRPSQYYSFDSDPDYKDVSEADYKRLSEMVILKNRHGESEIIIKEDFYGEYSKFVSDPSNYPNGIQEQNVYRNVTIQNEDAVF